MRRMVVARRRHHHRAVVAREADRGLHRARGPGHAEAQVDDLRAAIDRGDDAVGDVERRPDTVTVEHADRQQARLGRHREHDAGDVRAVSERTVDDAVVITVGVLGTFGARREEHARLDTRKREVTGERRVVERDAGVEDRDQHAVAVAARLRAARTHAQQRALIVAPPTSRVRLR